MSFINPKLEFLLPKYAEYGLENWLLALYEIIPENPYFLKQLFDEITKFAHPRVVGYTYGKIYDLYAKNLIRSEISVGIQPPYSTESKSALEEFCAGIRMHLNKVATTTQFDSGRFSLNAAPHTELSRNGLYTLWDLLEQCAVDKSSTSHVFAIFLILWREQKYTPCEEQTLFFAGYYRHTLAAILLQSVYIEPVYRGILDWHRTDNPKGWSENNVYEPFEPGNSESSRRHLFKLLCPEYAKTYEVLKITAEGTSFHQLCLLLRGTKSSQITCVLPDNL